VEIGRRSGICSSACHPRSDMRLTSRATDHVVRNSGRPSTRKRPSSHHFFCIEYKFATATSYERMEAGLALFYRQTGIQHPAIDTIRKETKAIKNKLPQVRGVPGEEEGSVGAEVDLTLLLEGVLKLPIATKMTKFFDEEETVLLRVTIDNAKETAQRCPRSTSSTSSTRPVSHLHMGGSGNKEPSREKSYPFSS